MILFDQLKISDNGKLLLASFHVNLADYFKNIYLKSITIMTADMASETSPLTVTSNYLYKKEYLESDKKKHDDLALDVAAFNDAFNNWNPAEGKPINSNNPYANTPFNRSNFSQDLFFIYVECWENVLIGCPPCRLDELTTLGVTFDENLLHQRVMDYTQELADECSVPQGFTDFILLWQAFKSAVETEHYIDAFNYWKMLFGKDRGGIPMYVTKPCGCHGKNSL